MREPEEGARQGGLAPLLAEAHTILRSLCVQDEDAAGGRLGVAGIGWATVELDRAAAELALALDLPGALAFRPGRADPLLGAASRLARTGQGTWVVLLEPTTEGRLAAFLARHDESLAAVYVKRAGDDGIPPRLPEGPLGRQRWLAGGRDGPWVILVEEAAAGSPPARDTIGP